MANYPQYGYQPQYPQYQPPQAMYQQRAPMEMPAPQGTMMQYVTSKEEAISCQIPFDGKTTYFFDTSNGKIYGKAFDPNTGKAPIVTYAREVEVPVAYATIDDLRAVLGELDNLRAVVGALTVPPKPKKKKVEVIDDDADD